MTFNPIPSSALDSGITSEFVFVQEKNPRHFWTDEQKTLLCVLYRWFSSAEKEPSGPLLRIQDVDVVFRNCFSETFRQTRNERSIKPTAINAMFKDMRSKKHSIYKSVYQETPFDDPSGRWNTERIEIRKMALAKDIELLELSHEEVSLPKTPRARRSQNHRRWREWTNDDTEVSDMGPNLQTDSEEEAPTISMRRSKVSGTAGSHRSQWHSQVPTPPWTSRCSGENENSRARSESPCVRRSQQQVLFFKDPTFVHSNRKGEIVLPYYRDPLTRHHPPSNQIAFRCFDGASLALHVSADSVPNPVIGGLHGINAASGFWAGAYSGIFTSPPSRNEVAFGKSIHIQLRPLAQSSPWISVWTSLISAVHRLIHSPTYHLSVIDLEYLSDNQPFEFPTLYPARSVISQYRLREIPYDKGSNYVYNGKPEWIVWEHIPQQAIIATRSYEHFQKHLVQYPSLVDILSLKQLYKAKAVREFRQIKARPAVPKDRETGQAIGALLAFAGIPERFLDAVAITAAINWEFVEYSERQNESYVKGVKSGFHSYTHEACLEDVGGFFEASSDNTDDAACFQKNFSNNPRLEFLRKEQSTDSFVDRRNRIELTTGLVGMRNDTALEFDSENSDRTLTASDCIEIDDSRQRHESENFIGVIKKTSPTATGSEMANPEPACEPDNFIADKFVLSQRVGDCWEIIDLTGLDDMNSEKTPATQIAGPTSIDFESFQYKSTTDDNRAVSTTEVVPADSTVSTAFSITPARLPDLAAGKQSTCAFRIFGRLHKALHRR